MSLVINQHILDSSDVIVLISSDGTFSWSSRKPNKDTAKALREIADAIDKQEDKHCEDFFSTRR